MQNKGFGGLFCQYVLQYKRVLHAEKAWAVSSLPELPSAGAQKSTGCFLYKKETACNEISRCKPEWWTLVIENITNTHLNLVNIIYSC